jgi:hypothetical protein
MFQTFGNPTQRRRGNERRNSGGDIRSTEKAIGPKGGSNSSSGNGHQDVDRFLVRRVVEDELLGTPFGRSSPS